MCGIAGFRRLDGGPADPGTLSRMTALLEHRGPDDSGHLCLGAVGLGHRRLSIIDVGGSRQPMSSAGMHLTYNGEIFNYRELRSRLVADGVALRTAGDTEVLLESWRQRGRAALAEVDGQFAFALYDGDQEELWLVRDRLGILPLYWYRDRDVFAFASEVKALLPVLPAVRVDEDALEDYLIYRSVPPPRTLFRGVSKLTAGHLLRVDGAGQVYEEPWWQLPAEPPARMLVGQAAHDAVATRLSAAVRSRLVADVPVGAYLSGGVDSSLVVALMKEAREGGPVATFSAGFADPRFDELPFARRVSDHLGTEHHEVLLDAKDYQDLWEKLTWHRDGPVSEPADMAVFKIAQSARGHVKVLLSGEGADELFGGYPKHVADARLRPVALLPAWLRIPLCRAIERLLPVRLARLRIAVRAFTGRTVSERLQTWFAPFTWYERRALMAGRGADRSPPQYGRAGGDHLRRMLYVDCHAWLSDNLLERGDRMSMAASIENRPPFLDHRLVETAFAVHSKEKVAGGAGKRIVKAIADRYLPADIVHRRKIGFRVPLDEWFRRGLREFTHDLLLAAGSFVGSVLDRRLVAQLLADHERGRRSEELRLWTLLGLEVWHRTFAEAQAVHNQVAVGTR